MKTKLLFSSFYLFFVFFSNAQSFQNGGFEQWNAGAPVYWSSPNFLDITQTTDKANGLYAAKLKDVTNDNNSYLSNTSPLDVGEKPSYVTCYFKFGNYNPNFDNVLIRIYLIDSAGLSTFSGSQSIQTFYTTYTPLTIMINNTVYSYMPNPREIMIDVSFNSPTGGEFFIDDFMYGGGNVSVKDKSNSDNTISIYPNPSNGYFTFNNLKKENTIEIYDITGRLILNTIAQNTSETIDLSDKQKGVYFYKIISDKKEIQQGKIIIQK